MPFSRPGVLGLTAAVTHALKGASYAPSTIKTHENQLAIYLRFLKTVDTVIAPWSDLSCVIWVLDAMKIGLAKKTLTAKVNAFVWGAAFHHGLRYKMDSPADLLYLLKRAIARRGDDCKPKVAITGDMLVKISKHMESGVHSAHRTQALAWFLLSYAGMLRASEAQQLNWSHIHFSAVQSLTSIPEYMKVTLQVSRDHIFKNHTNSIDLMFKPSKNATLCPVRHMWDWLKISYKTSARHKVFSLSSDRARALLKSAAAAVTKNANNDFGLHSLRAGGATDAAAQGVHLSEIMSMGRWTSSTVLHYIRSADEIAKALNMPQPRGAHGSRSAFHNSLV